MEYNPYDSHGSKGFVERVQRDLRPHNNGHDVKFSGTITPLRNGTYLVQDAKAVFDDSTVLSVTYHKGDNTIRYNGLSANEVARLWKQVEPFRAIEEKVSHWESERVKLNKQYHHRYKRNNCTAVVIIGMISVILSLLLVATDTLEYIVLVWLMSVTLIVAILIFVNATTEYPAKYLQSIYKEQNYWDKNRDSVFNNLFSSDQERIKFMNMVNDWVEDKDESLKSVRVLEHDDKLISSSLEVETESGNTYYYSKNQAQAQM